MVDINRINPDDPGTLKGILDRLAALEKQVKELPDTLPPERGLAQTTRQGYMSKEQVVALNANSAKLAGIADARSRVQVYASANFAIANNSLTTILFNVAALDSLGEYNSSTGVYTANHACDLILSGGVALLNPPDQQRLVVVLYDGTGGTAYFQLADITKSGPTGTPAADLLANFSTQITLAAGATMMVRTLSINAAATAQTIHGTAPFTWWRIHELV